MNSKTFCIIPWAHTWINPDGNLLPCCKIGADFPVKNIDTEDFLKDYWNQPSMVQLRSDLAQGTKAKFCNNCWQDESAGKASLRQEYNKRLAKHTKLKNIANSISYVSEDLPIALDLNLSNICNYKCLMCGPSYSSKIQTERKQNQRKFKLLKFLAPPVKRNSYWPNEEKFQTFFKKVMPNIRVLELKGGEPLLIQNVLTTIESITDKKNCILSITTNGSVVLDDGFIEQLKQFERIWMSVSVDGIGSHGEYVRYGSSWSTVHNTILRLSKLENCNFKLATVLQFYSSLTLPPVVDYALEHNLDVHIQNCTQPDFLNINAILPKNFAPFYDYIDQKIQHHSQVQWLKIVQGFLKSYVFDAKLHEQCWQYTNTMDDIRHNKLDAVQELFFNV